MTERRQIGDLAEDEARIYLENKGYRFLTSNFTCKLGEIDLIMQQEHVRVLVEVRARRPTSYGVGLETVGSQKQRKLIRAAQVYQQKENYWGPIRFDVVSIIIDPHTQQVLELEHIGDAFEA